MPHSPRPDPVVAAKGVVRATQAHVAVTARDLKYASPDKRRKALAAHQEAKRMHAEALIALRIHQIAATAPPLSSEQRTRLTALVASVGGPIPSPHPAQPTV